MPSLNINFKQVISKWSDNGELIRRRDTIIMSTTKKNKRVFIVFLDQ